MSPGPIVQAIPTRIYGCTFRSRTEAKWAVFFTHAGIPWEFEPEGFSIDGRGYLPDFRIRPHKGADLVWMEIKPPTDTFDDPRWQGLVQGTSMMLFTVRGQHRQGDVCGRDHTVRVWHPDGTVADVHRMWTGPEYSAAWDAASSYRFDSRGRAPARKGYRAR
jgi:hypothetical protein